MKWLKDNGRKPSAKDSTIIMSHAVDIEQLALLFDKVISAELLKEINSDLEFELNSIELYEDTISTLKNLKELGFKIALCSNLAMPYGERLRVLLPILFDLVVFSYEVGSIKPEQQIYEVIQSHFACEMADMLFIGDHPLLDVETPISLGMAAMLIERNKNQKLIDLLNNLINP